MKKKSIIKVRSYLRKKSKSNPRTKTRVKSYFRCFKASKNDKKQIYHRIAIDLRFQYDDDVFTKKVSPSIMREAVSILKNKFDSIAKKRDFTYSIKINGNKIILNITSPCADHKTLVGVIDDLINYTSSTGISINNKNYDIYISKMEIISEHETSKIII